MSPLAVFLDEDEGDCSVALFSSHLRDDAACERIAYAPWTCGVQAQAVCACRVDLCPMSCDSRIVLPSLRSASMASVASGAA